MYSMIRSFPELTVAGMAGDVTLILRDLSQNVFCALSISCFRLAFGIREVASANSALVDVWDTDNLYRVVGC